MGIAEFMVSAGYTCWIMEWQGHGESSRAYDYNFETIANEKIPLVFDYLVLIEDVSHLHCITHSGGGICLTIALINQPNHSEYIKSISMFGCKAFGAVQSKSNRIKIKIGDRLASMLGFVSAKLVGSPHDESYTMMKQWFEWNLTSSFIRQDGIDLKKLMNQDKTPVLSICGEGDTLIAPIYGCQSHLDAFNNPVNRLLVCGRFAGYNEDYNHSRALYSKNASIEIYPKVLEWITSHS